MTQPVTEVGTPPPGTAPTANPSSRPNQQPGTWASVAVSVSGLTVAYREQPVLWDVDLAIPHGAVMGVVGPNGAGKTTLIRAILGLVKPLAGRIEILGRPYDQVRRSVAYVPQRGSVDWDFPSSVLDVTMMGRYGLLGWLRRPGRQERARAMEALDQVSMTALADRQIGQLSGGQQQRVFLARALVQDAQVYFMDEPFAAVDAPTERAIVAVLHRLRDDGKTVVVVHHDLQTVQEYFDHVALLNVHLVAAGPVDEVFTARTLRAAYGGHLAVPGEARPDAQAPTSPASGTPRA